MAKMIWESSLMIFLFPGGSGGFAAQRSTHSELFLIFYPRFCVDYA